MATVIARTRTPWAVVLAVAGGLALLPLAAPAQTVGDWSAPDHGLRARLRIEPSQEPKSIYPLDVWIDFQSIVDKNPAMNGTKIFNFSNFDLGALKLTDSEGHDIPTLCQGVDVLGVGYEALCVPFRGTLSLPVDGYDPLSAEDMTRIFGTSFSGIILLISQGLFWNLPVGGKETYSLGGDFPPPGRVVQYAKTYRNRTTWTGHLMLPPVKIPALQD